MEKWRIENSEKSEISEYQENYSEVSILKYSQNQKLGFKNLGKKIPRFPTLPCFRPGRIQSTVFFSIFQFIGDTTLFRVTILNQT